MKTEYDLSDQDLHFLGTLQRKQAQLPSHFYQCPSPLIKQMINYIECTFNVQFIRPDATSLEQIPIAFTQVLNYSRSPKTQQAYMTLGCHFLIHVCFFTTSPVDISSTLFTWKNCAHFLKRYVTTPKCVTLRGTAGLTIPSMGMLNKCGPGCIPARGPGALDAFLPGALGPWMHSCKCMLQARAFTCWASPRSPESKRRCTCSRG